MKLIKRLFYRPYWVYAIADAIALVLSVIMVLAWFPLSTSVPFQKYSVFTTIFLFAAMCGYMTLMEGRHFSIWVLLTLWLVMMGVSLVFLVFKHAYRYALDADEELVIPPKRAQQSVIKPAEAISAEDKQALRESILEFVPEKVLRYI